MSDDVLSAIPTDTENHKSDQASAVSDAVPAKIKPVKEGYLYKKGGFRRNWKYRYFVLKRDSMAYFSHENSHAPINIIHLQHGGSLQECDRKKFMFTLRPHSPWNKGRAWYFQAGSDDERTSWMKALAEVVMADEGDGRIERVATFKSRSQRPAAISWSPSLSALKGVFFSDSLQSISSVESSSDDSMLHWPNDHLNRRLLDVDIILLDCRPLGNVSEIGGVKAECYHAHHILFALPFWRSGAMDPTQDVCEGQQLEWKYLFQYAHELQLHFVLYDQTNGDSGPVKTAFNYLLDLRLDNGDNLNPSLIHILRGGFKSFAKQFPERCSSTAGVRPSREPSFLDEPFNEIIPHLLLGSFPQGDVSKLKQHGIDAILNVSKVDYEDRLSRDIDYRFHLLRDEDSENMASVLPQLTDFIHQHVSTGRTCFVHCRLGFSRSAAIVVAYLVKYGSMSLLEAFVHTRQRRLNMGPRTSFVYDLIMWEQEVYQEKGMHQLPSLALQTYMLDDMGCQGLDQSLELLDSIE